MAKKKTDDAPFFIVGSGRSGSTLLRLILSSHSRICIPPETWFLVPLLDKLRPDGALSAAQVDRAVEIIISHYRWPDMGIDAADFRREAQALVDPDLRAVVELVYGHHLRRAAKPRWGDKTPPYIHALPALAELFPEARFIHLVRDGRDVAKSFQATGWYGRWLYDNCLEWRDAIRRADGYRSTPLAQRLIDVRYEDLVVDTERTIRTVCDFLGEPFEAAMLERQSGAQARVPERERHAHAKLSRAPQRSDIERWKTEMSLRELLIAEAFMGHGLRRMGYRPWFDSRAWVPLLALARVACTLGIPLGGRVWRTLAWPYRRIKSAGESR